MPNKIYKILGINPGSRYLGFAVCYGSELRDWGIKNIQSGKLNERKERIKQIIQSLIYQYEPSVLAIKSINTSRSSKCLNRLVDEMIKVAQNNGLKIHQFSIKALERSFSPLKRINKKKLAEMVAEEHPILYLELENEKVHKNPYRIRMFEAVALSTACFHKLDK